MLASEKAARHVRKTSGFLSKGLRTIRFSSEDIDESEHMNIMVFFFIKQKPHIIVNNFLVRLTHRYVDNRVFRTHLMGITGNKQARSNES